MGVGSSRSLRARCGWLVVVVAAAVAGVAACSSDDAASDPLSAAEFEAAYVAATERYADALSDVQATGVRAVSDDPVGAHEVYERLREVTEAAHAELAALTPPGAVDEAHARTVALLDEQAETLAGAVAASEARDDRALEADLARYRELLAEWREAHGALLARLNDDT